MSIGGIGDPPRFPSRVQDRTSAGAPTAQEQPARESIEQLRRRAHARRLARLTEEQVPTQERAFEKLDLERLRRERILDIADGRPLRRGSIVDFEV